MLTFILMYIEGSSWGKWFNARVEVLSANQNPSQLLHSSLGSLLFSPQAV